MPVRPARADDLAALAAVLTRAFHDDPVTAWVYASARRRPYWSERFFRWQLQRLVPQGATWTTADRAGAAVWALPGRWREEGRETLTLLRATLPGMLPRLPRLVTGLGQVEARHPEGSHLYLAALGVDPPRQGSGVGARLLAPGLERCDRDGLPAYLETSTERNLSFYGRFGFSAVHELQLPKGPRIWLMWREPGAS